MAGLTITRRVGESVRIGPDILVTFVAIDTRNRAVLKIEAPNSTHILRTELATQ